MDSVDGGNGSFGSWLRSKHKLVEKTAGAVVLAVEIVTFLREVFREVPDLFLTKLMNFLFLGFIYVQLRGEFAKSFSVHPDDPEVARILRLWRHGNKQGKISELVFSSNTLVRQLKNINRFILITVGLYVLLMAQQLGVGKTQRYSPHIFHFLIDAFSYAGAFFLLRSFFVMYERTVDERGNDILNKRTNLYIYLGAVLMALDSCVIFFVRYPNDVFITEFICGVVNAVIFILFIARFENKILDIPPLVLAILYLYAILQTCLPFVTNTDFGLNHEFATTFSSVVLKLCLFGKVFLAAVLFYVLNSKRIFYYFMTLRKIHEEEEKHWEEISPLIGSFSTETEQFSMAFSRNADSSFTAIVPNLFGDTYGTGFTTGEARADLLRKVRNTGKGNTEADG